MKTIVISALRAATLVSALLLVAAIASAKESADPAAQALATSGFVQVKAAGPYVEVGSYRIHVSTMLGQPSATLADGTWLYRDFTANGSAASGTLVVRFDQGRVTRLTLVSPRVETAMLSAPASGKTLVASK